MLYKAKRRGVKVVRADRFHPSTRTCSSCGHRKAHVDLSLRRYACHACGMVMDRDVNAAVNLKHRAERSPAGKAQRPCKPGSVKPAGTGDEALDCPAPNRHRRSG